MREATIMPVGAVGGGNVIGDQADDEGDETYIRDELGRLVPAEWTEDGRLVPIASLAAVKAPAAPPTPEITWEGALAALGWRLAPVTGGCQIRTPDRVCGAEITRRITGGWVCGQHYFALCSAITRRSA
jgi:hypothetical protein